MATVHERFRAWLSHEGWSQAQAAKALGLTQSAVSKILDRERGVSLAVGHKIESLSSAWDLGPIRTEEWLDVSAAERAEAGSSDGNGEPPTGDACE